MIPLRLQIKNFLSYGDAQVIDFTPHNLICLSGKNGHGKSALLDAMTWALWGQARKTITSTRPDQGLLKLGQSTMLVCLDFIFNGQEYRVRREFSAIQGKINTKIDFGLIDTSVCTPGQSPMEYAKVIPLTGKTSRETQDTIEQTLNLDFESFVHSSFLRQGQASEFSKKSPKERKEILAAILGLKKYDALRQAALNKVRDAQNEKGARNAVLEKNREQLAQKTTIEQDCVTIQQALASTRDALAAHEKKQSELLHEAKKISDMQRERAIVAAHQQQLLEQKKSLLGTYHTEVVTWRSTHRKLRTMADPAQIDRKRQELLNLITRHQEELQKQLSLKQEILDLTMAINTRESMLKQHHAERTATTHTTLQQSRSELNEHTQQLTMLATHHEKLGRQQQALALALEQAHKDLATRTAQCAQATTIEEQFERRKAFYQRFSAQGTYLKGELATLERKQHDLHDDGPSSCPLCEQNLSAARKRFLKNQMLEQQTSLKRRLTRMGKVLVKLKEILIEQNTALAPLKKAREEASVIEARIKDTQSQIAILEQEIRGLSEQKNTFETRIKSITEKVTLLTEQHALSEKALAELLANDEACVTARTKKTVIELLVAKTTYTKDEHEAALKELALLAQEQEYLAHLKQEAAQQTSRKARVHELHASIHALDHSLKAVTTSLAQFEHLAHLETDHQKRTIKHQEEIQQLRTQHETLVSEQACITLKRETLAKLECECAEELARIASIDEQIADFQALALATGKDGIQALIIEQALPEIENEANTLLARLTNNQAHITIESLRDLKKGGTKETLDINISDSLGVRPYELYSGGEAFRIDFAIRIAISKLLARRAGTSLQTLIIDEGFGSQDEDGLSKIMDAIYAIQEDFAKIIIVSHLTSMKDQFPVHFMIEKEPSGSKVQVWQQG